MLCFSWLCRFRGRKQFTIWHIQNTKPCLDIWTLVSLQNAQVQEKNKNNYSWDYLLIFSRAFLSLCQGSQTFTTVVLPPRITVSEVVLQALDGSLLELIAVPGSKARYVQNRVIVGPFRRPSQNFRVRVGGQYDGAPFQHITAAALSPATPPSKNQMW